MPDFSPRFKIIISCPGDVADVAPRVEKFLKNTEFLFERRGTPVTLVPLYWKNIVAPYNGERAQTVINVRFEDYDFYLGLLGLRFGTPTTTEEGVNYGSGTEEEFRIADCKRLEGGDVTIYLFFKNVIAPTETDPLEEYNRVLAFKREVGKTSWINSFDDAIDLTDRLSYEMVPEIEEKMAKLKSKTVTDFIEKAAIIEPVPRADTPAPLASLTADLPEIEKPIPRTVTLADGDSIAKLLFGEDYKKNLAELVIERKRLVVLGEAGSGKSTELARLAEFYQRPDSTLVPVFSRLNDYQGGTIADFLPAEFKGIPEDVALVILDGLDEIQVEFVKEAISSINQFSELHPQSTMVIACRSNFYELSVGSSSGTLVGFTSSNINEMAPADIVQALNDKGTDGRAFYREASENGYAELITKPFFLNILTAVYQEQHQLHERRDQVMSTAIRLKMKKAAQDSDMDQSEQDHLFRLLTRLGLVMEYLGRNYITASEMIRVIPKKRDRAALEHTLIIRQRKGNWTFEHNNIQEYFAASGMNRLSVEQIKRLVAFEPDFDQLKPSWMNSLSFLISISDDQKRQELLDWVTTIEPEAIIRFEPQRLDDGIRQKVFSAIFHEFQDNELLIRSNKFTEAELGRFGDMPEGLTMLKQVIASPGKSPLNKLSAMRLLSYFHLKPEEADTVKGLILQFIAQQIDAPENIYTAIHVLTDLNLADEVTVAALTVKFRDRNEPYYRASLYTLLNKAHLVAPYVDIFLAGIEIVSSRERVLNTNSLWDETAQLKSGLLELTDAAAIGQVLTFFDDPFAHNGYYTDKRDVIAALVKAAADLYPANPFLFGCVLHSYLNYGKTSDTGYLKIFRDFFSQTGSETEAFNAVQTASNLTKYESNLLLSLLLTDENALLLAGDLAAGKMTEENMRDLYRFAYFHTRQTDYETAAETLAKVILEKTGLVLEEPQDLSRQQKRRQHDQDAFNLLFDEAGMKAGLQQFWQEIGKASVTWNEVWDFANKYERDADRYFPHTVTDIVSELCRIYHSVSEADLKRLLIDTPAFEDDRMVSVYELLKNYGNAQVSEAQEAIIADWVNRKIVTTVISHAISDEGRIDSITLIIWFFIQKFNIVVPVEKLLDFTLFHNYNYGGLEYWYRPIIAQTGKTAFDERIVTNLESGIHNERVWANNAEYAIVNGLTASYQAIKADLLRIREITSVKEAIAKLYLKATDDQEGLGEVLIALPAEDFRIELVDLLKHGRLRERVKDYLLALLRSPDETPKEKLEVSKRLTELNIKEGFDYYADHILQNRRISSRYDLWFRYLNNLTSLDYLPRLMALFEKSMLPENTADNFTRIDGMVLDALFNLGIYSQENLASVQAALEDQIASHAPRWNYLLLLIKRMNFQFQLNRSQSATLDEAVAVINTLGL